MRPVNLLFDRRLFAPALAALTFALAGCGSSHGSSAASQTSQSQVRGPRDLAANLLWLMGMNQKNLRSVNVRCAQSSLPTSYPVHCTFTANDTGEPVAPSVLKKDKSARRMAEPHRVAGTATVLGVYSGTETYEYALNYHAAP